MSDIKRAGCCTLCDTEVFEIRTYYPEGSLMDRFPRKIGRPLEIAQRIEYALADGTVMRLTSCDQCLPAMQDLNSFPAIWEKVVRSWAFEQREDVRKLIGVSPMTPEQQTSIGKFMDAQLTNHMLGVIASGPWSDLDG